MEKPEPIEVLSSAKADIATPDELRNHYKKLAIEYNDLHFVAAHMWSSYQIGFPQEDFPLKPGDYPYKGVPFTGLGRTYDWHVSSALHTGVTEFVIRKDAEISVKPGVEPEVFCAAIK